MATDFWDESGEKLFDWVLRIGQDASEQAMLASAERLKNALRNARGEIRGKGPEDAAEQPSEWAKLSMEQFASLPEYRSIKEIIDGKLSGEGTSTPSSRARERSTFSSRWRTPLASPARSAIWRSRRTSPSTGRSRRAERPASR